MNAKALVLLLLFPVTALAQGFAGLGSEAEDFALPVPGTALEFPADHGAHPAYRIEWWYLTANLRGADGRDYGAQWTLFRSALSPNGADAGWSSPQVWMAHAAVTTPQSHHVAERFGRGGIGQAGVTAQPFAAWIDNWQMRADSGSAGIDRLTVTAGGADFSYALSAVAEGPIVAQGVDGYSVKGPSGQASHYYSQPFYHVTGRLDLPEGPVEVSGRAWLDREWSSQPLDADQTGWDWFAFHLDDGRKLMLARVRGKRPFLFGCLIAADGSARTLNGDDITLKPGRGTPPVSWSVGLPGVGLDLTVEAINPDSVMTTSVPYWEGPVRVGGTVSGRGYLEMTGYPLR